MFSLIRRLFPPERPTLSAIFVAVSAGQPMQALTTVTAIGGRGLTGDRYRSGQGHWQSIESCQVTLITEHELRSASRGLSGDGRQRLEEGSHRRNLVVRGIRPRQLEGRRFRIGQAEFRYHKPRPPCGYLDQVEGKGTAKAIGHYSGICLQVITAGEIAIGDHLELLDSN